MEKDISHLFKEDLIERDQPMFFSQMGNLYAMIHNGYKLLVQNHDEPELTASTDNMEQLQSMT